MSVDDKGRVRLQWKGAYKIWKVVYKGGFAFFNILTDFTLFVGEIRPRPDLKKHLHV